MPVHRISWGGGGGGGAFQAYAPPFGLGVARGPILYMCIITPFFWTGNLSVH